VSYQLAEIGRKSSKDIVELLIVYLTQEGLKISGLHVVFDIFTEFSRRYKSVEVNLLLLE
jgi:hypothetical protein